MVPPDRHPPDSTSTEFQLTPTDSTVMQMLGDWLKAEILPEGWGLFQGQQNRLPMPSGSHLIMQPTTRRPLATNSHDHDEEGVTISQPVELSIRLTARGPESLTVLGSVSTLWRDRRTVAWFRHRRPDMAPIDTGPLTQQDFTSAEQQYEASAILTLRLVIMTTLKRPAETATTLGMASMVETTLTTPLPSADH